MVRHNDESAADTLKGLKGITYAYLNVRSLFLHYDEIKILLNRTKLDLLILGETFLNTSVDSLYLDIEGYQFYHNDRENGSGKRDGGPRSICERPL